MANLLDDLSIIINATEKKMEQLKKGKRKIFNAKSENNKHLIINYLPAEMNEIDMKKLFSVIGEVEKVHLMRDMSKRASGPGNSLGYGFVDFKLAFDGERAVDLLNGTRIANKIIKVSFSRPSTDENKYTNVYISGLPQHFSQDDLEELYSNFGKIISSKVIQNQDESKRNVAFVRFENREQANSAIEATNNTKLKGCLNTIQVRFSNTPNSKNHDLMKRRKLGDEEHAEGGYAIYIYNLTPETDDNALWKLFGAFGAIRNAKAVLDPVTSRCKGFGFVTMTHLEEAIQAIQTLNGYTHDNRVLQVSFKNKDGDLDIKGLNLTGVSGTHILYVYNINPETDDTSIWKLFGQFGAVKNIKIMRDNDNPKFKSYGFITMKNIDEAADAVKVLNGFTLDGRVLQVSFKTKKNNEDEDENKLNEYINHDIPPHIATDKFGAVQIFVYNLAPQTEEKSLWRLFGQFGAVKNVKIIEDKSPKSEYRGHAFVAMKDYKDASLAVGTLNATILDSRTLQVSFKLKSNN